MLRASRLVRAAAPARGYATAADGFASKTTVFESVKPTASVTFLLKAGARYEQKPGTAHLLSNFAFTSNGKRSTLGTVRESELYGGILSSTLSREHLALTAEFMRGDEAFFVDVLTQYLATAQFERHELTESVLAAVAAESAAAEAASATHALELAHQVAFRSGLGNSLYADASAQHNLTVADVASLHSSAVPGLQILATGISQDALLAALDKSLASLGKNKGAFSGAGASASPAKSAYYGGSTRVSGHGPSAVFVGFGSTDAAATPALHALAAHLNPVPAVKWSAGLGPVASAIAPGVTVRAATLPYSDAALFGLIIEGEAGKLAGAAKAAVEGLKAAAGGVSKEDATRAVAKARFQLASALESTDGAIASYANGVAPTQQVEAVSALDGASVSKIAGELLKGKATFVAVGDTRVLPYADEVGLTNA
ncbi:LuxS/MPP-like metallohydrolase [Peniophora sp. CONT]|nr:LuxS/MPP-like metallohydrolase [Peniophora sp. CONT]